MADADKRRERIQLLKSLGFTHQQAFRFANAKGETIQNVIRSAKSDLESIPKNERTDSDKQKLKAFRGVPTTNNPRILTRKEKQEQWSQWSSKGGNFPARARNRISTINEQRGRDPFDSFGYQAYWFEYVEEFDDVDDGDFYEER